MGLLDPNADPKTLAAQNTMLGAILGRIIPQNGMVQQTAAILQSRPYQIHVQEAQALGQTPLTPEQFAATQSGLLGSK